MQNLCWINDSVRRTYLDTFIFSGIIRCTKSVSLISRDTQLIINELKDKF